MLDDLTSKIDYAFYTFLDNMENDNYWFNNEIELLSAMFKKDVDIQNWFMIARDKFIKWNYQSAYLIFTFLSMLWHQESMQSVSFMWWNDLVPYECKFGTNEDCAAFYDLKLVGLNDKGGVIRLGSYFETKADNELDEKKWNLLYEAAFKVYRIYDTDPELMV